MPALTTIALVSGIVAAAATTGGAIHSVSETRTASRRAKRSGEETGRQQASVLSGARQRQELEDQRETATRETAKKRRTQLARQTRGEGRSSTILTSPLGATAEAQTGRKTLLGA